MAKDQAYEQANASSKRMAERLDSMRILKLAGPDCTRIVEEFEAINDPPTSSTAHHEEGHGLQVKFRKNVLSIMEVVEQLSNPFLCYKLGACSTRMSWNMQLL